MPFIEITGPQQDQGTRERVSQGLTSALTAAWGITPEIVTLYFLPVDAAHYAHAGVLAPPGGGRHFLKVHAFARDVALKRDAARLLSQAFVEATGCAAADVIVYFFDRERHEVAHAGVLASD